MNPARWRSLECRLHPQTGPVPRVHVCLHDAQPSTPGGSRHAGLLPRHPSLRPSDGLGAGASPTHSTNATDRTLDRAARACRIAAPARADVGSTVPFPCVEVLVGIVK